MNYLVEVRTEDDTIAARTSVRDLEDSISTVRALIGLFGDGYKTRARPTGSRTVATTGTTWEAHERTHGWVVVEVGIRGSRVVASQLRENDAKRIATALVDREAQED